MLSSYLTNEGEGPTSNNVKSAAFESHTVDSGLRREALVREPMADPFASVWSIVYLIWFSFFFGLFSTLEAKLYKLIPFANLPHPA
jgi:hypothetical protein